MCKVVDYKDTSSILIDSMGTILGCQKPEKELHVISILKLVTSDLQAKHHILKTPPPEKQSNNTHSPGFLQ